MKSQISDKIKLIKELMSNDKKYESIRETCDLMDNLWNNNQNDESIYDYLFELVYKNDFNLTLLVTFLTSSRHMKNSTYRKLCHNRMEQLAIDKYGEDKYQTSLFTYL